MTIIRIDQYLGKDKKPLPPQEAIYRKIVLYKKGDNNPMIYQTEYSEDGFDVDFKESEMIYHEGDETPELLEMPDEEEKATEDNPNRNPDGSFAPKGTGDQTGGGSKDAINQPNKDLDDTKDTKDTKDTEKPVHWNKHVYTVQPESQEAFDNYVKEQREKVTPTKEEIEKNKQVQGAVINAIKKYVSKQSYGDKMEYAETQGSFAKGTDLAGSSDLDIFVAFKKDKNKSKEENLEDLKIWSKDMGENILKGMADEGSFKLVSGAKDKKYGEANVQGVEVQILAIADVTLEDIQNGEMVSDQDRSPHHTKYMKEALKGKTEDARVLKRFMKDAGVYDASQKSQGFSGFSTEVLIDQLGSFENVLEYFANFEKGSTLGEYSGTDKTPIRIGDPIDPSRNLGSAFSQQEGTDIVSPNKKLARLIKTAQAMLEKGEMPNITTEKLPSISLEFNVDKDWGDANKISGQLNKAAHKLWKKLEKEGFTVKAPKDKVTEQWSQEIPRINVNHDEETGKATIDFGFDNFDRQAEIELPFNPTKIPEERRQEGIDNYLLEHKDDEIVKNEDGTFTRTVTRDGNVQDYMNSILKNELEGLGLGDMTKNVKAGFNTEKVEKEFENLTDRPKGGESYLSNFDFEDVQDGKMIDETKPRSNESCGCNNFGDFINIQMKCLKLKAKEGQDYGLLYDQPKVEGRKIKGTLAYAGVSLNNRLYLPEELAKGDGMTVPLILNHASTAGAEGEMGRLPQKFSDGLQKGLEMKVGEVTLNWQPDDLTLYYEGTVDDEFFQKEIDDANMAVSLGLFYDSDSPQVCDTDCYTVLKGAEFHEVSLVYHAGFPVATIEAVESIVRNQGIKAMEFSRSEDPLVDKKSLNDINWSD